MGAQVLAKHAEDMKKRAEEAEASAKRAKLRCRELLEEHQQQDDQLNGMINEDKEAHDALSGETKQVSGGNNGDATKSTEEKQEKVVVDRNDETKEDKEKNKEIERSESKSSSSDPIALSPTRLASQT